MARDIFCYVYIRVAQLIVTNCACDLDSNSHTILFLNDKDSAVGLNDSMNDE